MRKLMLAALAAMTLLPLLGTATQAQERRVQDRRFEDRRPEERFRDRDIRRFRDRDIAVWRGGGWIHGRHTGRDGWWWVVNGTWYWYPAPVYPFPDPYVPPAVAAVPPGAQYWYFCRNPRGYYPYVPTCRVPWQAVPAA